MSIENTEMNKSDEAVWDAESVLVRVACRNDNKDRKVKQVRSDSSCNYAGNPGLSQL